MQVLMKTLEWQQDKLLIFQNSFPHHTWNDSTQDRVVLYFDFWHPGLSMDEQRALQIIEDTKRKFEASTAPPPMPGQIPEHVQFLLNRRAGK